MVWELGKKQFRKNDDLFCGEVCLQLQNALLKGLRARVPRSSTQSLRILHRRFMSSSDEVCRRERRKGRGKALDSRQHQLLPQASQFLLSTLSSSFCLPCLLLLHLELVGKHAQFVVFLCQCAFLRRERFCPNQIQVPDVLALVGIDSLAA